MRGRQGKLVTKQTDELQKEIATVDEDIRAGRTPSTGSMVRLVVLVVLGLALLGGFVMKMTRVATRNHPPSAVGGFR